MATIQVEKSDLADFLLTLGKGRIFSIVFDKVNGEQTKRVGTMNFASKLVGGDRTSDPEKVLVFWSLSDKAFRSTRISSIRTINTNGNTYQVN
jgi:hypothetical protein